MINQNAMKFISPFSKYTILMEYSEIIKENEQETKFNPPAQSHGLIRIFKLKLNSLVDPLWCTRLISAVVAMT